MISPYMLSSDPSESDSAMITIDKNETKVAMDVIQSSFFLKKKNERISVAMLVKLLSMIVEVKDVSESEM